MQMSYEANGVSSGGNNVEIAQILDNQNAIGNQEKLKEIIRWGEL